MDSKKILVFGDAMLDKYVYGSVARVSPEAPVPVVDMESSELRVGGAGNVACNCAALGADVAAVFALGTDANSEDLRRLLSDAGVDIWLSAPLEGVSAIVKTRVVGNGQQVVRIDANDAVRLDEGAVGRIRSCVDEALKWADVAVISDYGKGMCADVLCGSLIAAAQEAGVPVIVDPKGTDWTKYEGASVITPNMKEMNALCGSKIANDDAAVEAAWEGVHRVLKVDNVLLTRSEMGMSLINDNGIAHTRARTHEVFDVSGAGDTVVAVLAAELMPDLSNLVSAVALSNVAAGISVGKAGTSVVSRGEIEKEMHDRYSSMAKKTFLLGEREGLLSLVERWRKQGETVVATSGCFDIVHRGHMQLFNDASRLGDRLVVALNSDASVKRLKGEDRPINGEEDRAFVLASLANVDAVALFDPFVDACLLDESDTTSIPEQLRSRAVEAPMGLMKILSPDVYVKGGDYDMLDVPEAVYAKRFVSVAYVDGYSTTRVVERCR